MRDLLFLDRMITPTIITFIYWLALLAAVIAGLGTMFGGMGGSGFLGFLMGILVIVFGVIAARIWCELLIVLFRMNEALQEIRRK
jgi:hypothetical protein